MSLIKENLEGYLEGFLPFVENKDRQILFLNPVPTDNPVPYLEKPVPTNQPSKILQEIEKNVFETELIENRKAQAHLAVILKNGFAGYDPIRKRWITFAGYSNPILFGTTIPITVAHLLEDYRINSKRHFSVPKNPNSLVNISLPHQKPQYHPSPFKLKDKPYLYYFPDNWLIDRSYAWDEAYLKASSYLWPKEIVESRISNYLYDEEKGTTVLQFIMFNETLNRVPTKGGIAERYNYLNKIWEPNAEGIYSPSSNISLKEILGRITR